jgi:hypothetical protein
MADEGGMSAPASGPEQEPAQTPRVRAPEPYAIHTHAGR